jgi:DNA-binding PadR family transcriptional regulator
MSGYELATQVDRSIGYFWNVTRSQLYREIKDLEARGLIATTPAGARERRVCTITDAGRAAFARWIAREPPEELIRFPILLSLFFGEAVDPERLRNWVTLHRARHSERLEHYRKILPKVEREHPYPAMTLQFGIIYEEAVLRWFDGLQIPPNE